MGSTVVLTSEQGRTAWLAKSSSPPPHSYSDDFIMFVNMLYLFVTVVGVYCCSVRIVVQANIIRPGFSSGYNVSSSGG